MNLCISQNVPSYSPGTFHSSGNGIWIGQLSFFHPCSWYNDLLYICPCNHQCSYQLKKTNQFKCLYFHLKIDLCLNLLMDDFIQGLCFLVADTQLYKRLCPSVGRSVGWSVTLELKSGKTRISAPAHPSATGGRVSGLVFFFVGSLVNDLLWYAVQCR